MIQKHSTSKFATNLNLKSTNPTKTRNKNNCVFDTWKQNARNAQWNTFKMKKVSNTDINKLNWRLNHIFLMITNRDSYCMVIYIQRISWKRWRCHHPNIQGLEMFKAKNNLSPTPTKEIFPDRNYSSPHLRSQVTLKCRLLTVAITAKSHYGF